MTRLPAGLPYSSYARLAAGVTKLFHTEKILPSFFCRPSRQLGEDGRHTGERGNRGIPLRSCNEFTADYKEVDLFSRIVAFFYSSRIQDIRISTFFFRENHPLFESFLPPSIMRFAALSTVLLALAQHVHTLPVETDETSTLDITLSRVTDTRIKAVVKNSGSEDVTFVHLNFFRDTAPVKKVNVFKNGI